MLRVGHVLCCPVLTVLVLMPEDTMVQHPKAPSQPMLGREHGSDSSRLLDRFRPSYRPHQIQIWPRSIPESTAIWRRVQSAFKSEVQIPKRPCNTHSGRYDDCSFTGLLPICLLQEVQALGSQKCLETVFPFNGTL